MKKTLIYWLIFSVLSCTCIIAQNQNDCNLEVINPDDFLPEAMDSRDDILDFLGFEFGMKREKTEEIIAGYGWKYRSFDNQITCEGVLYEGCNAYVYLVFDNYTDCLMIVSLHLYNYGDINKVLKINSSIIKQYDLVLYGSSTNERVGIFGDVYTDHIDDYFKCFIDENGKILWGQTMYRFSESGSDYELIFWRLLDPADIKEEYEQRHK